MFDGDEESPEIAIELSCETKDSDTEARLVSVLRRERSSMDPVRTEPCFIILSGYLRTVFFVAFLLAIPSKNFSGLLNF